jgi:hypothetical protein
VLVGYQSYGLLRKLLQSNSWLLANKGYTFGERDELGRRRGYGVHFAPDVSPSRGMHTARGVEENA